MSLDGAGNLVVADLHENSVCKMNLTTGAITTVAGSGAFGGDDGPAGEAQFRQPTGVAVDRAGNIFVADSGNHAIRRIAPDGTVTTAAGASGIRGSADGVGGAARFDGLNGLQIALPIAFIVMIVSEMLTGSVGLGGYLIQGYRFAVTTTVFAGFFVIGGLGYALLALFAAARRRLLAWHEETAEHNG